MNDLSPDELQTLTLIIQDQHGLKLNRQQFTDISLDLFGDISGLEEIYPEQAMELIWTEWVQTPTSTVNQIDDWGLDSVNSGWNQTTSERHQSTLVWEGRWRGFLRAHRTPDYFQM